MSRGDQPINIAYLSLGSNINPETNLTAALRLLSRQTELSAVSSVWETKPVGFTDQANFLNMAVIVKTELAARDLKQQVLLDIERKLKRVHQANKNAPRTIDLDISLFNRHVFQLGDNHIPDPDIFKRPFIVIPLAEIAADYIHPETGQTLAEIASHFTTEASEMSQKKNISQTLKQYPRTL